MAHRYLSGSCFGSLGHLGFCHKILRSQVNFHIFPTNLGVNPSFKEPWHRGSAYWEAVPFLSSETDQLEDWRLELQKQRRELAQLQAELRPAESWEDPGVLEGFTKGF